jgi:hypothetical protein
MRWLANLRASFSAHEIWQLTKEELQWIMSMENGWIMDGKWRNIQCENGCRNFPHRRPYGENFD